MRIRRVLVTALPKSMGINLRKILTVKISLGVLKLNMPKMQAEICPKWNPSQNSGGQNFSIPSSFHKQKVQEENSYCVMTQLIQKTFSRKTDAWLRLFQHINPFCRDHKDSINILKVLLFFLYWNKAGTANPSSTAFSWNSKAGITQQFPALNTSTERYFTSEAQANNSPSNLSIHFSDWECLQHITNTLAINSSPLNLIRDMRQKGVIVSLCLLTYIKWQY